MTALLDAALDNPTAAVLAAVALMALCRVIAGALARGRKPQPVRRDVVGRQYARNSGRK